MNAPTKIMPVEPCNAIGNCMASPSSYRSSMESTGLYRYSKPTDGRVAEHALRQLEEARAKDIATHERNAPALAANAEVRQRVETLMTEIGMPRSFTERDTKSRARYPKSIRRDAGFITDLAREVKTGDSFELATTTYERLKKEYDAFAAKAVESDKLAEAAKERERQAVIEKRKADMALATILLRYELPMESSWTSVLEALRGRDQRLDLAVAMEQTRGDWSEGAWRVRNALGRFTVETTEDKDIANCVLGGLEDFEDGRVFRDMTWSYDALYASVADQQLAADVRAAATNAGD